MYEVKVLSESRSDLTGKMEDMREWEHGCLICLSLSSNFPIFPLYCTVQPLSILDFLIRSLKMHSGFEK